ncbi:hypothetical protein PQX77_020007 [Marasmius sp. AFHP31]|nr:hypothetical protein PQX77_020007 [Marasmius sp. AFHP31]
MRYNLANDNSLAETTQSIQYLSLNAMFLSNCEVEDMFNTNHNVTSNPDEPTTADNHTDGPPPLQDVSDSDWESLLYTYPSEESDSDESDQWFSALSSFSDVGDEIDVALNEGWFAPDSEDDDIVLNYESDTDTMFSHSDYIDEYHTTLKLRPAVENFAREFDFADSLETRPDGKPRFCWADQAKETYGYPESHWSDFYIEHRLDPTYEPEMVGNLVTEAAEYILEHFAPYPGDEYRWGCTDQYRINVFQLDENNYEISDLQSEQGPVVLPACLLHNPKFRLAAWYAKRRAEEQGLDFDKDEWNSKPCAIGDPYLNGIGLILAHGTDRLPESDNTDDMCDPYERFEVFQFKQDQTNGRYRVYDHVEQMLSFVHRSDLQNFEFDLVGSWCSRITERRANRQVECERSETKKRRRDHQYEKSRMWRDRRQGQVLARALEQCLEDSQPFPGDGDDWGLYSRITAWDAVSYEGTDIVKFCDHERDMYWYFEKKDLLNRKFSPGKLWSLFCAADADVPDFEEMDYPRIGDILAKDAKQKLTKWVPYDSGTDIARENWYNVYQDPRNPKQYVIEDSVREFEVKIPTKLLLNSNFNLPLWFQKRLDRARHELEGWFRGPATYECLSRLFYEPVTSFRVSSTRS